MAVCAIGLLLALPTLAADTPSASTGLARALEQAWRLHPQAAGLDAREAEARAAQEVATGLTPEPPSVAIGSLNDRYNRNLGRQEWEVELAAPLWLPGQKAAREAEAASRVEEAAAKRAALRWGLAGELREAWWSLAAARNVNALAIRRLATAQALEADVRRRYTVGELSRIDANLAQAEVLAASAEQAETETALLQAEQALRTLTGTVAPQDVGEEVPTTLRRSGGLMSMPDAHPSIVAAAAATRSARARVTVADESRRAAPELALRVVRERGDFAEPYANTVGIRLKIPFSSGPLVRRETSAAKADADQADAEMIRAQTRTQLDAERAERTLASSERQLIMAQERRLLSAENLRLAEKAFSLGESDLATLLRIRAAAYDAEAFLDRQRVARAAAISRLNQALGVLP
ncbi:TolC family protein [Sulfuritalea sp.]|uniref:TolC family protein n=1 Tax=Sulfuritalea sp. TaxID=2480090 RepID=UPI001AC1F0F8|nr:TolC family protein [Sulfuritalea sp.]MBN8475765.1 TolC family protein [Sulfuritalea sp.]